MSEGHSEAWELYRISGGLQDKDDFGANSEISEYTGNES